MIWKYSEGIGRFYRFMPIIRLHWIILESLIIVMLSLPKPCLFPTSFALMQKKQKIKAEKPVTKGAPWSCLPRGATRHACGMAQTVPLPYPRATPRPRPICGTAFYAIILQTENPKEG
jgi:hypothetical protein